MIETITKCNRCGKTIDELDEMNGFGFTDMLDYSMKYKDKVFDIDLCADCWQWLMEFLSKDCRFDPLVSIDEFEEEFEDDECPCECPCEEHNWEVGFADDPAEEGHELSAEDDCRIVPEVSVFDHSVRVKTKNFTINVSGADTSVILGELIRVFSCAEGDDEQED